MRFAKFQYTETNRPHLIEFHHLLGHERNREVFVQDDLTAESGVRVPPERGLPIVNKLRVHPVVAVFNELAVRSVRSSKEKEK